MKRAISVVLVILTCMFLLTGCGLKIGDFIAPDVNGNGPKDNEKNGAIINPLTGEATDKDLSANRPYCVMINNHPSARPCAGLSQASMIYEAVVEGGITRIMGVFNDIDGITVGSIRSCRPYYLSISQAYDAIYVHAGGSEQAYSDIKSLGIDNIDGVRGKRDGEASSYYRDKARKATGVNIEHTLFADGSKLASFANTNYTMTHASDYDTSYGLRFSPNAVKQCKTDSAEFEVFYSSGYSTVFKYNAENQCYNPYIKDKEYYDDVTTGTTADDVSIDITNVIILNVPTKSVDSYGRQAMELTTNSGTGYFCCGGKYIEINWTRADRSDNFHYTLSDGTPLALGIGKTYVCIADLDHTKGVIW